MNIKIHKLFAFFLVTLFLCSRCMSLEGKENTFFYTKEIYCLVNEYKIINFSSDGGVRGVVIDISIPNRQEDGDFPYSRLLGIDINPEPGHIRVDGKGNRVARFTLGSLQPGEKREIVVKAKYQLDTVTIDLDRPLTGEKEITDKQLSIYLEPSPFIENDHPEILKVARQLTYGENDGLKKAREVYRFVSTYLDYSLDNGLEQGALAALQKGEGSCDSYASLMTALLRGAGIPARRLAGEELLDPKHYSEEYLLSEGGIILQAEDGTYYPGHAWVEFYLPELGWIPADPTFHRLKSGEKIVNYVGFGSLGGRKLLVTEVDRENQNRYRVSWNGPGKIEVVSQTIVYPNNESR